MTGTYRFQTRFYGRKDMPAEFQKTMDYKSIGLKNTYCFLNNILIFSKGSEAEGKKMCSIAFAAGLMKIFWTIIPK